MVISVGVAAVGGAVLYWRLRPSPTAPPQPQPNLLAAPTPVLKAPPPTALYACARCHALPPPDLLPRSHWPPMIDKMTAIIETYRLGQDITPDELTVIRRYYNDNAPDALAPLPPDGSASPLTFDPIPIGNPPAVRPDGMPPMITNVRVVRLDSAGHTGVLVCDALEGTVSYIGRATGSWRESPLARDLPAPAHTEVADLDGDGRPDIAVACLGGLRPTEDPIGQVVLLMNNGPRFVPRVVLSGVARACDVRPADVDGDGDIDLIVAAFGLYKTGGALWLERTADGNYTPHVVLQSNGVSHVPVADLNADGKPDFVALVSQEHEQVIAFVNSGAGNFDKIVLWQGPHPMYGCSGIELADMDRDGDADILFTNGDALDIDTMPKPWHGVQWLENLGDMRFRYHDIGRFYGAYRAVPVDLDGDGDIDVVATSMMNAWDNPARQAVIWFENDGSMSFTPRVLSTSPTFLVTADVGDLTGNGRQDIVTGGLYVFPPYYRVGRVTLFENKAPAPRPGP
jgi:hypothetical protein